MKISEKYDLLETAKTPRFSFPVGVKIEYKLKDYRFRATFTENSGQPFTTNWLWNIGLFDIDNKKAIEEKLEQVENYINQELQRNIDVGLMESRRIRNVEAKINRLFE